MNGIKFKKPLSVLLSMLMATSAMPLTAISVSAFEVACQNEDCSGTYSNGFCCDCDGYEAAIQTTDKYDVDDDGIMDTVYEIGNAGQLYWFADNVNNGEYDFRSSNAVLTSDITVIYNLFTSLDSTPDSASLESTSDSAVRLREWSPIGTRGYTGTFDSNNHTVSGLYNESEYASSIGFIDTLFEEGTVKNLGVEESIFAGDMNIGGVVGYNKGNIINCYNAGKVSGTEYVAGIAGNAYYVDIIDCHNTGKITGYRDIGGIVGSLDDSCIKNCSNSGNIEGDEDSEYVGGIYGYAYDVAISDCYNKGDVSGFSEIGGISGYSGVTETEFIAITRCYNIGKIEGEYIARASDYKNTTNCYYLAQNETDKNTGTTYKTAEQFKSGEVAYLLQSNVEVGEDGVVPQVWGQKIGTEDILVLSDDTVYLYIECDFREYTNEQKESVYHNYDGRTDSICNICGKECKHNDIYNGFCLGCGEYEPANEVTYTNEDGIEITEYEIANAGQLYWFAQQVNEGEYHKINGRLVADINVNHGYTFNTDGTFSGGEEPREWIPIGGGCNSYDLIIYRGNFNGDGYTISGLYVNDVDTEETHVTIGLFGYTSINLISNINISNSYFYGQNYVSPIVGVSMGYVSNCSVESSVTAISETGYVSGLVGLTDGGEINNCYSFAKIMGDFAGGLTSVSNSVICNSYTNYSNLVNTTLENSQIINSYYLSDIRTDENGKTKAQFESGEVASLLNGENAGTEDAVWKQTIGVDAYPLFEGDDVNFDTTGYKLRGTLSLKLEETKLAGVYRSTIDLPAGTYKFVVDDVANNKAYGRASTYTDNISNCIFGNNWGYCTLETTGGRYTFTFNSKNNHLEVVCDNSNVENLSTYKVRGSVGLALSKTENADVVKGTAVLSAGLYRFVVTDDATGISYGRSEVYTGSIDKALCGNN